MTPDAAIHAVTIASCLEQQAEGELLGMRMAVMRQLLASLSASRTALLAMDLAAIEHGTREQFGLSGALGEIVRRSRPCAFALAGELKPIESEVLQALRLHSALLVRMQRKIRVMANMLADRNLNYCPWPQRTGVWGHALNSARGQRI
jgi:hypothetical protein